MDKYIQKIIDEAIAQDQAEWDWLDALALIGVSVGIVMVVVAVMLTIAGLP